MLLLYPSTRVIIIIIITIYIPLCFYFILSAQPQYVQLLFIYIPLCFYFIANVCLNVWPLNIFTFHYASTLSSIRSARASSFFHLHSTMLLLYLTVSFIFKPSNILFTFHYASTLSIEILSSPAIMNNLHSTMLLLYPQVQSVLRIPCKKFTFHYASTLSYPDRAYRGWQIPFTFHYASTLSEALYIYRIGVLHLHSTMLLLYPGWLLWL